LRFSNDDTEQILALVDNHMRFGHVSRMKESTLKRFLRMPKFDEHLALHRADSLASHGNLSTYELIQKKLGETPPTTIRPRPLVTGDDLIAAGYVPGPKFREMLEAVEDAQLEGRLASHEAALEFVRREFPL
jgi:poly(A) polymerase